MIEDNRGGLPLFFDRSQKQNREPKAMVGFTAPSTSTEPPDEATRAAAKKAAVDKFISSLPRHMRTNNALISQLTTHIMTATPGRSRYTQASAVAGAMLRAYLDGPGVPKLSPEQFDTREANLIGMLDTQLPNFGDNRTIDKQNQSDWGRRFNSMMIASRSPGGPGF